MMKSKNKKWLYVSIRYSKILNKVILDKDYQFNGKFTIEDKSKVNSLYGDLVYKCNFLIYGDEDKIKELQEKNKNDFYICVSCDADNQKNMNVFNSVNTDKLNKNYGYVNFFEENIDNFKFKIKCENEEDFFNKFFNLCEKSINEENKTLDDLLKAGLIEKINSTEGKFSYMYMKKDDIYKEFMTDFVRGLIAGKYNVRDFCNDYSEMESKIYNNAKKIASNFVDNFDENIKNFIKNKEEEEKLKQKQQEKFNKETFDKFKSFVLKGVKEINYPCIGCKVGDKEDCNCDFTGYEVIFDERRGIWNLRNDYNYSDDFKNKTLYLQFGQYTRDPQMIEKYNGVGYYFYGKKICDFDYDEIL